MTAYRTGNHLLGHDPVRDLLLQHLGMRERTYCRRGCSFSFSIGYEKTIEEGMEMVKRTDKNVP